jgi:hypothetical protein
LLIQDFIVNYKGLLKFKARLLDRFYSIPNQVALELKPEAAKSDIGHAQHRAPSPPRLTQDYSGNSVAFEMAVDLPARGRFGLGWGTSGGLPLSPLSPLVQRMQVSSSPCSDSFDAHRTK